MEYREEFLGFSSTAWSGLGAISTFLAVLVALASPYIFERLKINRLFKLILNEMHSNISLVKTASDAKKCPNPIQVSLELMANASLCNLNLDEWKSHRNTLSTFSAKKYLRIKSVNDQLSELLRVSSLIGQNGSSEPAYHKIFDMIEAVLNDYRKTLE